jgi:hypothetical protein
MSALNINFKKNRFNFLLPKILEFVNSLDDEKGYELTIKNEKRSNDANAYYWALINKLAGETGIPPKDIYRTHIKDVGGNYAVVPIRDDALETWINNWNNKGLGWLCESIGESKLRGYTNVICFYGSSTYDTRQMSRLIDLCVQDCKAQGIETMTPAELSLLMEGWKPKC